MVDKELMRLSREEIARQFQLPERKSKIATLLKQEGQAYCICRTSDSSRFMIGCDSCEEWYHGDCIGLTEKDAKYIKQFFCIRCQDEDPSLKTRFKFGVKPEIEAKFRNEAKSRRKKKQQEEYSAKGHGWTKLSNTQHTQERHPFSSSGSNIISKRSCGRCNNCLRLKDCGECRVCRSYRSSETCLNRQCYKQLGVYYPSERDKKKQLSKSISKSSNTKRKRKDSDSENDRGPEALRQCYGPTCVNAAKPRSKYCSDACGLRLATNRIFQILPQRIHEWSLTSCVAEGLNIRELETVRKQQFEVRLILHELDKRHVELDAIINRAKNATVDTHADDDADDDNEMSMYCITCGHEIHSRTAIKHMEKCFNKYESQSSFGSIYKTKIEGNNMFCDFYNQANQTYCKRLRVLCPEHYKDPKISDSEVCGCPLVTNVFNLTGEFCRASKKVCIKHYCWDKLRRAEIDLERVRQWLKLDELIEQERQIRQKMADRAGVMALMMHSTYNHELMEQLARTAGMNPDMKKSDSPHLIDDDT